MGWVVVFLSLFISVTPSQAAPFKSSICQAYLLAMRGEDGDQISMKKETRRAIGELNKWYSEINTTSLSSPNEKKAATVMREILDDFSPVNPEQKPVMVIAKELRGVHAIQSFFEDVKSELHGKLASDQRKIQGHEFTFRLVAGSGVFLTGGAGLSMWLTNLAGADLRPFQMGQAFLGAAVMTLGSESILSQITERSFLFERRLKEAAKHAIAEPTPHEWMMETISTHWNPLTLKQRLGSSDHDSEISQAQLVSDITPSSIKILRQALRKEPKPLVVRTDRLLTFDKNTDEPILFLIVRAKAEE